MDQTLFADKANTSSVLEDQIAFLMAVMNNSSDGIACYKPFRDDRGDIVDFVFELLNDSALTHTPGSKEDYIGKKLLEKFPYNAKNGMFDSFRKTAETGIPSYGIYYYDEGDIRGWFKNYVVKHRDYIIVYYSNDTEKTELQIQLKEKTVKLESILLEKEKLLKEKEVLLQETHHRVKNNLQIISSLLNLQSRTIDDPKAQTAFESSIQRIRTMALIHEKLYRDKNFYKMELNTFIQEVVQSARNFYYNYPTKIDYKVKSENLNIDVSYCVNIGLIINEIVMNSIKHAFNGSNKGEIVIEAKKSGEDLNLVISDNGCGLPKKFNINENNSLGLTLVQSLVEQMDAVLTIKTIPGTTFTIRIPGI
jgi:two-component sensor histidine kinase